MMIKHSGAQRSSGLPGLYRHVSDTWRSLTPWRSISCWPPQRQMRDNREYDRADPLAAFRSASTVAPGKILTWAVILLEMRSLGPFVFGVPSILIHHRHLMCGSWLYNTAQRTVFLLYELSAEGSTWFIFGKDLIKPQRRCVLSSLSCSVSIYWIQSSAGPLFSFFPASQH